jgi:hypothetical protein
MTALFAALQESGNGTKRQFAAVQRYVSYRRTSRIVLRLLVGARSGRSMVTWCNTQIPKIVILEKNRHGRCA